MICDFGIIFSLGSFLDYDSIGEQIRASPPPASHYYLVAGSEKNKATDTISLHDLPYREDKSTRDFDARIEMQTT